jgi:hypothetical protein
VHAHGSSCGPGCGHDHHHDHQHGRQQPGASTSGRSTDGRAAAAAAAGGGAALERALAHLEAAMARPRECWRCGSQGGALKKCTGCQVALYCSRECQVAAWHKDHKADCKVWKLVQQVQGV